jgi:O-antigen/teichoic acid export membrane protein
MQGLKEITTRGGLFLGLRYGLGILIGLGNMLVLTWWIGPHAYGLFVTAVGITTFLASLARAGADTYLVRMERQPNERLYQLALTLIGWNALALVAVGAGLVPLLVRWFGNREFVAPYLALLATIPLAGWAGPPTAKLERALDFGKVAGIELGGQLLALVVSVILAWRHMGVWAPVAGLLAWQLWAMAAALRAARIAPRFVFDAREAHAMLSFGLGYTMSLRAWQLRTLVNPLIVGRFAGADGVAFVGLAIRLAEGLGFVRIAAGRLAIAALSRLREQPAKLRAGLQKALELQVMTLGPPLCVFAAAGPFVVGRVIGMRWLPSLALYPWIAAAVLVNSVYNLQASALFVLGEQWTVFRAYAVQVGLLALATWLLLPRWGIVGYGCADLLACGAYAFLHAKVAQRIQLSYRRLASWTFVLLLPLFSGASSHRLTSVLLWTPLLALAVIEGERRWSGREPRLKNVLDSSGNRAELVLASTGD